MAIAPFVYEEARQACRSARTWRRGDVLPTIGGFRADLGRSSGRLVLGQEVPELLMRARAAGLRGMYVPAMRVHHHIPAKRLTRAYFRRWWFGKGVSRAGAGRMQPVTELGVDLRTTPHILSVPRYMYGSALRDLAGCVRPPLAGRPADAFRHEMMLAFFAGYFWARVIWRSLYDPARLDPAVKLSAGRSSGFQIRHESRLPRVVDRPYNFYEPRRS